MAFNTGNPIGSTDARDLSDNAENFDTALGTTAATWVDRFGVTRDSFEGRLAKGSFYRVGTFAAGYTLTNMRQTLEYSGVEYSWAGSFPKVVSAGATPATSGGIGAGAWVDRNSDALRTDLAAITGADLIPTLQSVYCATGLDTTGVTNESSSIAALLAKYDVVKLPKTGSGFIRADITVPTGKTLLGSGRPVYDTVTATWSSDGTLVKGAVSVTNKHACTIGNIAIDSYDLGTNTIAGASSTTNNCYVKNVATRANNHNMLFEQNGSSAIGENGGNILVEDCIAYEGPNGFVSKMKGVTFLRCKAVGQTVQGFVVVSDNINGPGVFSRASDTTIEDCEAIDCNEPIRIYSRNYHDGVDNVKASSLTKIIRFNGGTPGGRHIRVGDFSASAIAGGYTRILNDDVIVDGGFFIGAPYSSIRFENANRPSITNCPIFGSNGSNVEGGDNVYELTVGDVQHVNSPAASGLDIKYKVVSNHTTAVDMTGKPTLIVFQNPSPLITVSAAAGLTSVFSHRCRFKIDDVYTICTFTGVTHFGKGTVFDAYYDGTSWVDLGEVIPQAEVLASQNSAAVVVNFGTRSKAYLAAQAGVSITSVTLANATNIPAGEIVHFRITNSNASPITIAGWAAGFIFADGITAPTALGAFKKVLLKLYSVGGGSFVVTSVQTYT